MIGADSDLGYGDGPDGARVGAGFHGSAGWCWLVGSVVGGLGGVQGLEAFPGGGQVGGPFPAGWDFENLASGVGDEAGRGGQEPEPQGLGRGLGEVAV